MNLTDQELFELLCTLIVVLVSCYLLYGLVRVLERSREGLKIGRPVAVAAGVRLLAAAALGQLSIAKDLRGGDELTFLARAGDLSELPLGGSDSLDALISELHTFLFSVHYRALDAAPPELMLRTEMILFSVVGVALLSAAVYELAGPGPARIAAWVLALEPANIFFSSVLHKEPIMYLAEGMVVYGGALLWKRDRLSALAPLVAGCAIAMATRPYVGWFLTAAAAAVVLHASLRRRRGMRSLVMTVGVLVLVVAFVPTVWNASSDDNLRELQQSQDANARDDASLALERVDYSTRSNLILNLPKRIRDVILRPYVWQTANASQQLGALGTMVVLACLSLLIAGLARNRHVIMDQAAPLVYPAVFMLIAYAISAGNAGTAYRYRTHIVNLAVALVVVLMARRYEEHKGFVRMPTRAGFGSFSRTRTTA